MQPERKLPVVLCWHMHQPEYRDLSNGAFTRPWTYLHAIKDYTDMAAHLEAQPRARAVINFSPVLLRQLEAYEAGLKRVLQAEGPIGDPLLDALAAPELGADPGGRDELLRACLRLNRARMVEPFPVFAALLELAASAVATGAGARCFSDEFMQDLLTWYHLAWLGASVREGDPRVSALLARGRAFRYADRRDLVGVVHDCIAGLSGRYRALAAAGQIEISVSPWGHPILPLLIDFHSARESQPELCLPVNGTYPNGLERARWHLARARQSAEDYFGITPAGCWPSEGALSQTALAEIASAGYTWTATGQGVLDATLKQAGVTAHAPRVYRHVASGLRLFARDDELSDRIGFVYANWDAEHAVGDLEHALMEIAAHRADEQSVVAIIMDGENAWEHFSDNASAFLSTLYERLGSHERIELTTFSAAADTLEPAPLPPLVAGSWVYGNLSTWIGEAAKNGLWDLLAAAKACLDRVTDGSPDPSRSELRERQLAVCEGSDWFWWPSDHQPRETVSEFESLFGMHLANLYRGAGLAPPPGVRALVEAGRGEVQTGPVMRPARDGPSREFANA